MLQYVYKKIFDRQGLKFIFLFILTLSISIFFLFLNSVDSEILKSPFEIFKLYIVELFFSFFITFSVTISFLIIEYFKKNSIFRGVLFYITGFFLILISIAIGNFFGSILPSFLYNQSIFISFKNTFLNVLSFSLVCSIVVPIYADKKNELEIKKNKEKDLLRLADETKHEVLLSKINSHFLFNTLTSISAYIDIDSQKSQDMIEKLSDILQYSIKFDIHEKIPLENELKIVNDYLYIEKYRFGTRLDWNIEIENGLNSIKIPELTIQPLVENSIKYNISKSINGGAVEIKIYKENQNIIIICEDFDNDTNKQIKKKSPIVEHGFGIGLKNINERLKLTYNNNAFLETSKKENGFKVKITIPYEINKE